MGFGEAQSDWVGVVILVLVVTVWLILSKCSTDCFLVANGTDMLVKTLFSDTSDSK